MGPVEKAKRNGKLPAHGTSVITEVDKDLSTSGFFVKPHHIDCRQSDSGKFWGYIPGGGGDLWWVKHKDGGIGAYMYTEVSDIEYTPVGNESPTITVEYKELPMCEHCGEGHEAFGVEIAEVDGGISWCLDCIDDELLADGQREEIEVENKRQTIEWHKQQIKELEG